MENTHLFIFALAIVKRFPDIELTISSCGQTGCDGFQIYSRGGLVQYIKLPGVFEETQQIFDLLHPNEQWKIAAAKVLGTRRIVTKMTYAKLKAKDYKRYDSYPDFEKLDDHISISHHFPVLTQSPDYSFRISDIDAEIKKEMLAEKATI